VNFANRFVKTMSDITIGTVIVLFHVALAEHQHKREQPLRDKRARELPN
jgi:hypothetical protein